MTAHELLMTCRHVGIILAADGDYLDVDAPAGALTPELRDQLARHKPALVALLAPVSDSVHLHGGLLVCLHGGLTIPVEPMRLLFDLQARGFTLTPEGETLVVQPFQRLTDEDCDAIRHWKRYLLELLRYQAPGVPQ